MVSHCYISVRAKTLPQQVGKPSPGTEVPEADLTVGNAGSDPLTIGRLRHDRHQSFAARHDGDGFPSSSDYVNGTPSDTGCQ